MRLPGICVVVDAADEEAARVKGPVSVGNHLRSAIIGLWLLDKVTFLMPWHGAETTWVWPFLPWGLTSFFRFTRVNIHMKRIQHFPARGAASFVPPSFLFVLAFLVLPGCSGGGAHKSPGGFSVLPYSVGVFLEAPSSTGEGSTAAGAVLENVCTSLQADGAVVSRALALSSTTTPAALREGRNMDFLVGVRLETEETLPDPEISSANATLEVFTWLFGGIPAWFVPTLEYPLAGGMEFDVFDLNDRGTRNWLKLTEQAPPPPPAYRLRSAGGSRSLSLVDRSGGAAEMDKYLLSIIMPPMLVEGEPETVRSALNEEALTGFLEELRGDLRARLSRDEKEKPLRIVFAQESGDGLFAFEILSKSPSAIGILDLHRIAEGAERYRWVLRGDELQRVNGLLERDGRARVEVPEGVPLVVGRNLVKVRALRNDGIRVSRTVVLIPGELK